MKNTFSILAILGFSLFPMFSQEFGARVLDKETKKPVPFATVQYATNKGAITNDEGFFVINAPSGSYDSIMVSSIGYESNKFKVSEILDHTLVLKSQVIQLDDVFLTNKKMSGRDILERAKSKVAENYSLDLTTKRFFFRQSSLNHVNRFDLHIDESTIPDINQALMDSVSGSIPKYTDSYKEVLGDLYGDYSSQKIQIIKAANLYNPQSTTSLEKITKKLDEIFKENVKKDSYLKIKSGIFGVKVDADELAEEKEEITTKNEKLLTAEEIEKSQKDQRKELVNSTGANIHSLMKEMFWNEDVTFDLFEKLNRYRYKVQGYTYLDQELVYIIEFNPKGGADFRGKIYVNTDDFGVHRVDYYNVKPLKKFRLLGISAMDDAYRGKMIFSKDETGHYIPKYIEKESGESFGIDRPLTLIEKNKNVLGRRKQNELDMDIFINVSQLNKYQLVIYDTEGFNKGSLNNITTSEEFDYKTFKRYDAEFWNGFNIMEPNAAIKEFTALEEN